MVGIVVWSIGIDLHCHYKEYGLYTEVVGPIAC